MRDSDPITRLRAARFDGPQALFTEAVRLLSERTKLPGDLAGLVARLRKVSADARNEFAEQWADAQYTGERPDLEPITAELAVERVEDAADAIEALAAIPLRPEAEVEKLRAERDAAITIAETAIAEADTLRAAQADYEARIMSAITLRPEAEVRAEAWAAAIEAAAVKCIPWSLACSEEISALTQPADISAALDRIKAEAKAEGMRKAARIAKSRAGSPDYEPPSPYDRGYAAAVAEVERAILAAITEVRK